MKSVQTGTLSELYDFRAQPPHRDESTHGSYLMPGESSEDWMAAARIRAQPNAKIREEDAHADLDALLLGYEDQLGALIGRVSRSLSGVLHGEMFPSIKGKIDQLRRVLQQVGDTRARLTYERCKKDMSLILVDENVALARAEVMAAQGDIGKVIAYAKAIAIIKEQLRPHMRDIMALQGSPLGYSTDGKDYGEDVVSNVIVEGLLRGFSITNNEITIISGRFYGNKNGYERLVKNWPGLTCLEMMPTVPQMVGDKGAIVGGYVAWKLGGAQYRIDFQQTAEGDFRLPIRVNGGMGMDAILGKAKKKMLSRVLERISGIPEADDADGEILDSTATPAASQESLPAPSTLSPAEDAWIASRIESIANAADSAELKEIADTLKKSRPELYDAHFKAPLNARAAQLKGGAK